MKIDLKQIGLKKIDMKIDPNQIAVMRRKIDMKIDLKQIGRERKSNWSKRQYCKAGYP